MTRSIPRLLGYATAGAGLTAAGYVGLVTGACPIDLGIGRRVRPLGPQLVDMDAPREVVFDVIAQPYLGRVPRALADKVRVLERGSDMVLAAHVTPAPALADRPRPHADRCRHGCRGSSAARPAPRCSRGPGGRYSTLNSPSSPGAGALGTSRCPTGSLVPRNWLAATGDHLRIRAPADTRRLLRTIARPC